MPLVALILAVSPLALPPVGFTSQPAADTWHTATVLTVDGELRGRVVAFDLAGQLQLEVAGTAEQRTISTRRIIRLAAGNGAPAVPPAATVIELAGGDRLSGSLARGSDETVKVISPALGTVEVPLSRIATIRTNPMGSPAPFGSAVTEMDEDVILLRNGDTLRGLINQVDEAGLDVDVGGQPQRVPLDRVAEVRFAGAETGPLAAPAARLTLADGGTVTVAALNWTADGNFALQYENQAIDTRPEQLTSVEIVGGDWCWLTELKPAGYINTPMLQLGWDYHLDRNVLGRPLRVGGRAFDHGIGVHSRSVLIYELGGRYDEFVTRYGLDASAGPLADVEVLVLVDGDEKLRVHCRVSDGLAPPQRINVDGASRLELIVEFGENGAIQDRFDWIEPYLLRNP